MRVAGFLSAMVALALASCAKAPAADSAKEASSATPRDAEAAPAARGNTLTCTGNNGLSFVFSFGSPKVGELFAVDVEVKRSSGSLPDGLTLRADATMPEHGHGMMTKPETKPVAAGRWRSEGWKFNMHGKWQLEGEVTGPVADRCVVAFEQPPETAL